VPQLKKCKICKKNFVSYSSLQNKCHNCTIKTIKPKPIFTEKQQKWSKYREILLIDEIRYDCEGNGYWTCQLCDKEIYDPNIIDYHHIKTRGAAPELYFVRSNLLRLCHNCHLQQHGQI
jgi:rRNA maturation protein Nop10